MIATAARGVERTTLRRAQIAPDVSAIGAVAADCLVKELETWPKPGLVSHVDNGSHDDMDAGTFRRSAAAIRPYLQRLADAGALGCGMGRLRIIGLEAEGAMFAATSGINTHRGAIFGLGLLCAAAGARAGGLVDPRLPLGDVVTRLWGDSILDGPVLLHSHGSAARRRFRAGGARIEAATGFPSIYRIGLTALRRAMSVVPQDAEAARVEACFALIASVEDTNLLHRGGLDGLRFAHDAARRFIASGGVCVSGWRARAQSIHDSFIARRLSPGGSADLLAMTLFVDAHERPTS
ncbi:triphosphoribosyl-dephospho-CoA synthase MdcB [Bradyrhizobium japonicum]|uniref:triphosphoribosyl-dephospho-CoA synthase MdcB n=1 Tax=Bradyrhizobium japonicum TaxID=375 RepID=UPI001BA5E63F|nr:triphosphoribosyl-dephospho-CoA synthase MdcB [Bradyrhizobium japonicum]MBR0956537.1 triphosphoribosyl-dephospho-CoA synthase MdcB [Bradyrhizobium japonicum]